MAYTQENNLITKIKLALTSGTLWTKATSLDEDSEFDVFTQDATAAVRGTIFGMTKNIGTNTTEIKLIKGKIKVAEIIQPVNNKPEAITSFIKKLETTESERYEFTQDLFQPVEGIINYVEGGGIDGGTFIEVGEGEEPKGIEIQNSGSQEVDKTEIIHEFEILPEIERPENINTGTTSIDDFVALGSEDEENKIYEYDEEDREEIEEKIAAVTGVPDETTPDETAPDETTPEETAPDETAPDETAPDETACNGIKVDGECGTNELGNPWEVFAYAPYDNFYLYNKNGDKLGKEKSGDVYNSQGNLKVYGGGKLIYKDLDKLDQITPAGGNISPDFAIEMNVKGLDRNDNVYGLFQIGDVKFYLRNDYRLGQSQFLSIYKDGDDVVTLPINNSSFKKIIVKFENGKVSINGNTPVDIDIGGDRDILYVGNNDGGTRPWNDLIDYLKIYTK